jgi:hypothetical protein
MLGGLPVFLKLLLIASMSIRQAGFWKGQTTAGVVAGGFHRFLQYFG